MKFLRSLLLSLLLAAPASAADYVAGPGVPASSGMGGVTVANLVCDGSTDNATALQATITAASGTAANTVYIPPATSACMLSQKVTIPSGVNLWAFPGSVTLKAKTGNASSPLLLSFSGNATGNQIYGLTLDGGGTGFANTNNTNTVYNSNNVVFDHVTVQNTAGIGITFSTTTTNSGVRDSTFTNVGSQATASFNGTITGTALVVNSGLTGTIAVGASVSGSGVALGTTILSGSGNNWVVSVSQTAGPVTMNTNLGRQGVAFCCGVGLDTPGTNTSSISGTTLTTGNSQSSAIIGQYIYSTDNGSQPDTKIVSGSGTSWVVSVSQTVTSASLNAALNQGNFVKNSYFLNTGLDSISYTQQRNFAAQGNYIVSPGPGGAGIYDHSNDTTTVTGNTIFGTTTNGNGIDLAATFHAVVTGNSSKFNGGSGIAIGYASDASITGNVSNNNGQNGFTGQGASDAGVFLTGAITSISNVTISGNDLSDIQSSHTQQYGVEMQNGSTFSNIIVDPSNITVGNVAAPLSPLLVSNVLSNTTGGGATATVTITIAAPAVVTHTAHGYQCLTPVYYSTSGALPTGMAAFTTYYITCGAGLVTANTYQLSTTLANALAGTSLTTTGTQSGTQTESQAPILSSGSATDVVGEQLPAGVYNCVGNLLYGYGGSTSLTNWAAWLGTAGGSTLPYNMSSSATTVAGVASGLVTTSEAAIVEPQISLNTTPVRISLTAPGMVVLSTQATYTVSSVKAYGTVRCWPAF